MRAVTSNVSDDVHRALVNLAITQRTTVEALIAGAATALAWNSARPMSRRVAEAHSRGLTDGEIGTELGLTRLRAKTIRADLGLTANRSTPR